MKCRYAWPLLLGVLLVTIGCTPHFGPLELQGRPAMVAEQGQPRLWVLTKQEETRRVGATGRRAGLWPDATLFHFQVQAFDPVTARPLWSRRILTLGDARPTLRRTIVGSAAGGRVLGQDGDRVWLLVDDKPLALALADGTPLADTAAIERRNPDLKGLLPVDAGHFGFDRGLVFTSADAQRFVIRGDSLQAQPYTPRPRAVAAPGLKANGMPVIVPTPPYGDNPARQVVLDGRWLGLYSPKEAQDAADDPTGMHLRWPYTVTNEGALARRTFWRGTIIETRRWDERIRRLGALSPIPGAPTFLKGRFLKDLRTGEPLLLASPEGFAVWHGTRVDRDGRLALTRLDASLRTRWSTVLPLSETGTANQVMYWLLPGHVVAMGDRVLQVEGTSRRVPHLVSLSLTNGRMAAWNLPANTATGD
jgi:hypothetical protein